MMHNTEEYAQRAQQYSQDFKNIIIPSFVGAGASLALASVAAPSLLAGTFSTGLVMGVGQLCGISARPMLTYAYNSYRGKTAENAQDSQRVAAFYNSPKPIQ